MAKPLKEVGALKRLSRDKAERKRGGVQES